MVDAKEGGRGGRWFYNHKRGGLSSPLAAPTTERIMLKKIISGGQTGALDSLYTRDEIGGGYRQRTKRGV